MRIPACLDFEATCSPILAVVLFLAFAGDARSIGFGGYLEFSHADGRVDFQDDVVTTDDFVFFLPGKVDYDSERFGIGFVLDTNVARNRLFNYRFKFGYQHTWRDFEGSGGDFEADGFTMNHVFGFSPLRRPDLRVWLGPAVRFSVDAFDEDDIEPLDDVVDLSGGVGPAVGLNWHMGSVVSGSVTLSYQYMFLGEVIDFGDGHETYDGREHLVTLGVSLMFRTRGDQYEIRTKPRRAAR